MIKDLTGQRFGRLTVASLSSKSNSRRKYWLCVCDCGGTHIALRDSLKSGHTKSCGCLASEVTTRRNTKHGLYGTKEYMAWQSAKARCFNPNDEHFHIYGGRGISMHKEWQVNFASFFEHVGKAPTKKHEIDRIDVHGHYEPGNVRWVTHKENCNNRQDSRRFNVEGAHLTGHEVAKRLGITYYAFMNRLYRWNDIEKAINTPARKRLR